MARPRKTPDQKVGTAFTVRLRPEVAERVEELRARFQEQTPFTTVTMADVLRTLVTEASARPTEFGIVPILQERSPPEVPITVVESSEDDETSGK